MHNISQAKSHTNWTMAKNASDELYNVFKSKEISRQACMKQIDTNANFENVEH